MIVTVLVEEAIQVLEKNRDAHVEEYKLQLYGWKEAMTEYGNKMQEWSKTPDIERPREPNKPSSYVEDYEKLINKLTYHAKCKDTIELEDYEYSTIFENKFSWVIPFRGASTTYNTSITADKISAGVLSANVLDIE